ncbi:hypothetical protein Tsubulata_027717 [Turnera subulata]|uniref:Wall-associated receptor kinase galacturonan-binding domain-containing protein n=1 Tax=Turnera subulata TaxID=218843 RepID=A0A9Q0G2Y5_9ROSI|nr:hypothetical protein Tsubulata_027717 [Turnera subulata]
MNVKLVIAALSLMFMLLLLENIPQAKANLDCGNQTCGNISIPYPFGLAPGCYKDDSFKIECHKTSNPPRAVIPSIKAEVLKFSDYNESVTVKGPIKYSGSCPAWKRRSSRSNSSTLVNLTGSPFIPAPFSNSFTAVGCNTLGTITEDATLPIGCRSTCGKERGAMEWDSAGFCQAQNCCTTSVKPGLQVIIPSVQSLNKGRDDDEDECKLAFLADEQWLVNTLEDVRKVQGMEYVPLKLAWVSNFSLDQYQETMDCGYSRGINDVVTATECKCRPNYEGSPYNPQGCTGIHIT